MVLQQFHISDYFLDGSNQSLESPQKSCRAHLPPENSELSFIHYNHSYGLNKQTVTCELASLGVAGRQSFSSHVCCFLLLHVFARRISLLTCQQESVFPNCLLLLNSLKEKKQNLGFPPRVKFKQITKTAYFPIFLLQYPDRQTGY